MVICRVLLLLLWPSCITASIKNTLSDRKFVWFYHWWLLSTSMRLSSCDSLQRSCLRQSVQSFYREPDFTRCCQRRCSFIHAVYMQKEKRAMCSQRFAAPHAGSSDVASTAPSSWLHRPLWLHARNANRSAMQLHTAYMCNVHARRGRDDATRRPGSRLFRPHCDCFIGIDPRKCIIIPSTKFWFFKKKTRKHVAHFGSSWFLLHMPHCAS